MSLSWTFKSAIIFVITLVFEAASNPEGRLLNHLNSTVISPSMLRYHSLGDLFQDCLPPEYETTQIACTAASLNFTSAFYGECLERGVIRIVGEFEVVNVSCSANFHLDFDFDGFQPTEAIRVSTWKELTANGSSKAIARYHLELKIYSNEALYWRYHPSPVNNNATDSAVCVSCKRHEYSRTGNHIIHDMTNTSIGFPVYFFFEDAHLEPTFMFNNFTRTTLSSSSSNHTLNLYIPCRPSHAIVPATLHRILDNGTKQMVSGADYKPWKGFRVPLSNVQELRASEQFECGSSDAIAAPLILYYPPDPTKAFGFDRIFLQPPKNNKVTLNHEANPITRDPITVNITCVIQTEDKQPYMGSIGCENPTHIRLVREFILPEYGGMSYSRRTTTILVGDNFPQELKIYRHYQTGITFCVSKTYSRIYEYAAGLNRVMYQLDFGTDYTLLPHTSPPKEVHIHLELMNPTQKTASEKPNTVKLVIDRTYEFSCRIDLFTVARTIIWEIRQKNGTKHRVKVDYNLPGEFSYFSFKATWDIVQIRCSAVFWNNDKWRTDELETAVGYEERELDPEVEENIIIVSTTIFILLVIIGVAFFFTKKLDPNQKQKFSNVEVSEFENGNPSIKKETAVSEGGHFLPYDKKFEIEEKNFSIDWDQLLGSGEFGTVFKGTVYNRRDVAVKMVKPDMDKTFTKALLSELKIMIYLGKHENLLELVGAHTSKLRQGTVYLFLEFCPLGSLESFLRRNRHHLQPTESSPYTQFSFVGPDEFELSATAESMMSTKDLYTWSYQIAKGMDYLSNKQVIHGDLATRNILLDENKSAKICDFGLSRRLHNYKVYMKNPADSTPLPWPWMAPEALQTLTFSTKTDVWSFGVTVWEIFSLGEVPYPGMHCGIDFINKLREGMRNLRPKLAPMDMYKDVMKESWRFHPEDRPTFNELCFLLDSMLAAFDKVGSRNVSVSSDSGVASTVASGYVQHALTFSMGI